MPSTSNLVFYQVLFKIYKWSQGTEVLFMEDKIAMKNISILLVVIFKLMVLLLIIILVGWELSAY